MTTPAGAWTVDRLTVEIEKRLCTILGREWSAAGISIESLLAEVTRRLAAVAPAKTQGWIIEQEADLAKRDAELCGQGFLCDGVRIAPERMTVVAAVAPAGMDEPAKTSALADWLEQQMPGGTVISNPRWWAPRIMRALAYIERNAAAPTGRSKG